MKLTIGVNQPSPTTTSPSTTTTTSTTTPTTPTTPGGTRLAIFKNFFKYVIGFDAKPKLTLSAVLIFSVELLIKYFDLLNFYAFLYENRFSIRY